ncbi:hypothetical protein BKA60DRAFT_530738 [Fusarium oxysporum]|nr:hypothetical protein BKA60DRAFT_532456 [Fusarium oxysporum]KAH7187537.1 hypothetical protein DER44DRAFT_736530 [Fusarium oxysporum]KAH7190353.1 hypothetical protein BKA60DRAFT_530738 [Fusarium oxysporum]
MKSRTDIHEHKSKERDKEMGEVKLVTVGSEAKESMIDFSEKSGNSLFSTAGSPVTNQEQVEASSSADILLWEEGDYLEDIMQHLAHMEVVLFLSVNLIDRYCSRKQIGKEYYLLLGSAALWIASKYDGKAYQGKGFARPSAKEISELCNGMFDEHMIAQMEISILFTLDWVLGHPTTDQGIKFLLVGEPENKELASMAAYLSEISLYHREFVGIKPSVIAESCCMLAKIILYGSLSIGDNTEAVVMETLNSLWKHVCQPPPAISEKYLRQNRHYVAQIVFSRLADSTGHATIKLGVDKKCGYMYTYYFLMYIMSWTKSPEVKYLILLPLLYPDLIWILECEFARGLTVPRLFNPDGIKALLCTVEIVRNPGDSCSSIKYRFSETAFTIESFDAVWKKCKSHLMHSEWFQDKIREYGMSHWGFCNCINIDETRSLL